MKKLSLKKVLFWSIAAVAICAAWWFLTPRYGLFDRAILIASGPEWIEPTDKSAGVQVYEWLNNREVIIFKRTEDDKITLLRQQVIPAGIKSPAMPMPVPPFRTPAILEISPSKKTLELVYDLRSSVLTSNAVSEFISLQDGRTFKKNTGVFYGVWREEDSSFWLFNYQDGLSAEVQHYDTGKKESRTFEMFSKSIKEEISCDAYDPSGRVIAFGNAYDSQMVLFPKQTVYDFNLNQLDAPVRKSSFNFPKNMTHFDCDVSISGNKIFWEVLPIQDNFTTRILSRLPPPWKPRNRIRWIVSDLQGENMHAIAEYQVESTDYSPFDVSAPKLTPDGKYVSFIYHQGLYLLPTN